MPKKDWKSKAKNPPAGKEGPGALLMGTANKEVAANKVVESTTINNKEDNQTGANTSTDANIDTSIDASTNASINKSIETSTEAVTFTREKIKVKKNKPKFTDTHSPLSTYIRNDLYDKLNRIAPFVEGGKAGIINRALEDHLQLYDEEE